MSKFDPYHEWLGLSKDRVPPTLYQLLSISQKEASTADIELAAKRASERVRQFQAGEHGEVAARVLAEIAAARTILTDPSKRRHYDASQRSLAPTPKSTDVSDRPPKRKENSMPLDVPEVIDEIRPRRKLVQHSARRTAKKTRSRNSEGDAQILKWVISGVVAVAVLLVAFFVVRENRSPVVDDQKSETVASKPAATSPEKMPLVKSEGSSARMFKLDPEKEKAASNVDASRLKELMHAMHKYYEKNGSFPSAAVFGPDGKPWHSWRVLLLPYLNQQTLYDKYDFSKPWDAAANKAVLDQMPEIFQDPFEKQAAGRTRYAASVGAECGLCANPRFVVKIVNGEPVIPKQTRGPDVRTFIDFVDGTSKTILLGRTTNGDGIPWTSPTDVPFEKSKLGFGAPHGFEAGNFAFANGLVRKFGNEIPTDQFQVMLTYNADDELSTELDDLLEGKSRKIEKPAYPEVATRHGMKEIIEAMLNYNDYTLAMPPAVVYGPDGRPWHSWRVLILPMLGERALLREYDFSRPWDDPKNRKILTKMPPLYADPAGNAPSTHTRYVLPCGNGTAYPLRASGMELELHDMKGVPPFGVNNQGQTPVKALRDGRANTILVGLLFDKEGIEWTKPEDVEIGSTFAGFDAPGRFASGHFGFADRSVRLFRANAKPELFRNFFTIAGNDRAPTDSELYP